MRDYIDALQAPLGVDLLNGNVRTVIADIPVGDFFNPPPKKRKKPAALTPLTLKLLREEGYTVAVVEHWNSFVRIRQDLFGFIDVLALGNDETIAVQCCRRSDMATRRNKIADHENVGAVRKAGWRIEIHGWDKHNGRWRVAREDLS